MRTSELFIRSLLWNVLLSQVAAEAMATQRAWMFTAECEVNCDRVLTSQHLRWCTGLFSLTLQ
jgi:hypothetical protein